MEARLFPATYPGNWSEGATRLGLTALYKVATARLRRNCIAEASQEVQGVAIGGVVDCQVNGYLAFNLHCSTALYGTISNTQHTHLQFPYLRTVR